MLTQLDTLRQDLKYAFRQLRRSPGFTLVAVGSLTVGIGANVTIYSAARAFLQRPPEAALPHELVRVYRGDHSPLPRDWLLQFSRTSRTLREVIAEDPMAVGFQRDGVNERVMASVVSENFFTGLGIGASPGSVFAGRPNQPVGPVAVLGYDFWNGRLGADPSIVGRTIRLNDRPFAVIGVSRRGFHSSQFGWAPAVFVPMSEQPGLRGLPPGSLSQTSFYVTGRLAPGSTHRNAAAELAILAGELPDAPPEVTQPGAFRVEPARGITAEARGAVSAIAALLLAVVGLVLLIACANLANLLLARATARRREIAIRLSLGVSRGRLVRQLLTESVVVALLGGAAGFGIAAYATRLLPRLLPAGGPEFAFDVTPDTSVLLFAAALAVATGILFGLAPALQASRPDIQETLRSDSAGSGARRSRLRSVFLAAQVALATVLLITAARFLSSLERAQRIDPGFSSERVVDLQLDLSLRQYQDQRGGVFYREVLDRVRPLPGVEAATMIRFTPLSGSNSGTGVALASADPNDQSAVRGTTFTTVTPGYFEMFNIPILEGRGFDATDGPGAPPVAVVNQSFARMFWPNGEAVGRMIRFGGEEVLTVVGVTPDTKYVSLGERDRPFLYRPLGQSYEPGMVLQVRLAHDTPAARAAIRQTVQALDPALPLPPVRAMTDDMAIALLPARLGAGALGVFGALALFLATIGVYGVTAYLVGQRVAEIGVRVALGATRRMVLGLMMRETLVLVAVGLGIGLTAGVGLGAAVSSMLYGVGALDPVSLAGAALVLLTVALFGTWLPARRALRVDPVQALRVG